MSVWKYVKILGLSVLTTHGKDQDLSTRQYYVNNYNSNPKDRVVSADVYGILISNQRTARGAVALSRSSRLATM